MVSVTEVVEVPAVVGEEADAGGGGVDFVEVEAEEEEAVVELMDLGAETPVHDAALVEAGDGGVFGGH